MVFYRKYRPQLINDLDNESVRNTLLSVLAKEDSTPHAFLFTGPKGLGKTSAARIVAKAINCEKKSKVKSQKSKSIEPCNECIQCVSITQGTNMDVLEIDAASNRGIDEIRDLREKIRLSPLSAKKKVYIIDEVHMLTTEAFNALLKTLEEPPSHAIFILCTTEPHKVPATIVSRSFHIQFKLATEDELVRSLRRIAAGEKLQIGDDVLRLIAQRAEGGFRDGTKILEELILSSQGQEITTQLVDTIYKVSSIKYQVSSIFDALVKRDAKAGLQIIEDLVKEGTDIKFFLSQMMEFLHEKLLEQFRIQNSEFRIQMSEIKLLFELLSKAYVEMKTAVLPQLPLELAVLEFIHITHGSVGMAMSNMSEVTINSLSKKVGTINKIKALYGPAERGSLDDKTKKTPDLMVDLMAVPANGEVTEEWIGAFWRGIVAEMKQYNHTIAGVLRGCSIKKYDQKQLIIETAYKFHKDRLDDIKTQGALIKVCKKLTGKEMEIIVELKKRG